MYFLSLHKNVWSKAEFGNFDRAVEAPQFRVGVECGFGMSGHVYFGDNRDIACGGIVHKGFDFFLAVESLLFFPNGGVCSF